MYMHKHIHVYTDVYIYIYIYIHVYIYIYIYMYKALRTVERFADPTAKSINAVNALIKYTVNL